MRIISGIARGTKINSIESLETRPTLDRVKEPLFSIIQNEIKDARVLDLFAGSGALGIEALSRGSSRAVFCENNRDAIKIIKSNLVKTHLIGKAELYCMDYKQALKKYIKQKEKFDIIFIDPPYKTQYAISAIEIIAENNLLKNKGTIILETDEIQRDEQLIANSKKLEDKKIKIIDKRKYGRVYLLFLKMV